MFFDDFVTFVSMLDGASNQRVREQTRGCIFRTGGRQFNPLAPRGLVFIRQSSPALSIPKMFQRRIEILRRIQIVLKQELNGAFARLTSLSHARQRWRRTAK